MSIPPPFNLGAEPELHAAVAKVQDRSRHVVISALVLEYRVAMGEAEYTGDALGVKQVLRGDSGRHSTHPTSVGGASVRAGP